MVATDSESRYAVLFYQPEDSYRSADGIVADRSLTAEADRLMKAPAAKQELTLTQETEMALGCCTEAALAAWLAAVARLVVVEPEAGCCTEAALVAWLAAALVAWLVDRPLPEGRVVWRVAGRQMLAEQMDGELNSDMGSKTNTVRLAQGPAVPGAGAVGSLGLG